MSTPAAHTPFSLVSDAALERLWARVRHHLERSGGRLSGSITLANLSEPERRAIDLLLGRRTRGSRVQIVLEDLDRSLRESRLRLGLVGVLEAQAPLRDLASERAARLAAEDAFWTGTEWHAAIARHPPLADWLRGLRRSGHLRRLAADEPEPMLLACLDLLASLPASGVDRAVLASDLFGDAHALDDDRPLLRLLLHALAHLDQAPTPARSDQRRDMLAAYGIFTDSTSTTVLVLNLRPRPIGPVTNAITLCADAAVPVPVTLQMLHGEPWLWTPGTVWVCENPTVLGLAARRLGAACPPMVCVEGMLSVAARRLLVSLAAAGVDLRYHGDFDKGGVRIANIVIGEIGARPWRLSAADYHEAIARPKRFLPIKGSVPQTKWDPRLRDDMEQCRLAVHEEKIVDLLVGDLEAAVSRS
jgi:uncharacterized protein (TIGR02679 family)